MKRTWLLGFALLVLSSTLAAQPAHTISLVRGAAFLAQGDHHAEQVGVSWMRAQNATVSIGAQAEFLWSVDSRRSLWIDQPAAWRSRYHGLASLILAVEPLRVGKRQDQVLGVRFGPTIRYRSDDRVLASSAYGVDQSDALDLWLDTTLNQTPGGQGYTLAVQDGDTNESDYLLGVVTQQTDEWELGGFVGLTYRIDLGAWQAGVSATSQFFQDAGASSWTPALWSLQTSLGYRF